MNLQQDCSSFLKRSAKGAVMLDVRSPGEYRQGHIPGALSFPLFSDDERAQVGTLYKQVGKEAAFELGLRIVGPKMADFVSDARRLSPEKELAIHCWRGGQRSGSMAWLMQSAGFQVKTLKGGYKAYRQEVLDYFENLPFTFCVLGGKTGSGKTKILHALAARGEQVLDLERLANHKGSAFGWIGEPQQPSTEQFENNIHAQLQGFDATRKIWVENESRSIGKVFIPAGLWTKMKASTLLNISIPDEARIQNLLADYVLQDKSDLVQAFEKIDRKLGGLNFKLALEALDRDDFAAAARIALDYYDKTYQHCLDINVSPEIKMLEFEMGDAGEIAERLL